MVINGVMATMATIPKASCIIFCSPCKTKHAPIANGNIKLDVNGPDATPPESNAIAVYIFGTKKASPKDNI